MPQVPRALLTLEMEVAQIMKGGYEHFMQKEIHEQPESIHQTMRGRVRFRGASSKVLAWLGLAWMRLQHIVNLALAEAEATAPIMCIHTSSDMLGALPSLSAQARVSWSSMPSWAMTACQQAAGIASAEHGLACPDLPEDCMSAEGSVSVLGAPDQMLLLRPAGAWSVLSPAPQSRVHGLIFNNLSVWSRGQVIAATCI